MKQGKTDYMHALFTLAWSEFYTGQKEMDIKWGLNNILGTKFPIEIIKTYIIFCTNIYIYILKLLFKNGKNYKQKKYLGASVIDPLHPK